MVIEKSNKLYNCKLEEEKFEYTDGVIFSFSELTVDERKEFSKLHGSHMEGILRTKYGNKSNLKIKGLFSHRRGIYLGERKFKSLGDVKSIFTKLIKAGKLGIRIGEPEHTLL